MKSYELVRKLLLPTSLLLVGVNAYATSKASDYQFKCNDDVRVIKSKALYGLSVTAHADVVLLPSTYFPQTISEKDFAPKTKSVCEGVPNADKKTVLLIETLLSLGGQSGNGPKLLKAPVKGQDLLTFLANATALGKLHGSLNEKGEPVFDSPVASYGLMQLCPDTFKKHRGIDVFAAFDYPCVAEKPSASNTKNSKKAATAHQSTTGSSSALQAVITALQLLPNETSPEHIQKQVTTTLQELQEAQKARSQEASETATNSAQYIVNGDWLDPDRIYMVESVDYWFSKSVVPRDDMQSASKKNSDKSQRSGNESTNANSRTATVENPLKQEKSPVSITECNHAGNENCDTIPEAIEDADLIPPPPTGNNNLNGRYKHKQIDYCVYNGIGLVAGDRSTDWRPPSVVRPESSSPNNDNDENLTIINKQELWQEDCRMWRLSVQGASLSFDLIRPNLSDATVNSIFPGVYNTAATQQHSRNFSFAGDVIFASEGPHTIVGVDIGSQVSEKTLGDSSVGEKYSFATNEAHSYLFLSLRNRKRTPRWSYFRIVPVEFQSGVFKPIYQFQSSPTSFLLNVEARRPIAFALPKVGTRIDGKQTSNGVNSFAEVGWEDVHQENVVSGIEFLNPGRPTTTCSLEATLTFQTCAKKSTILPSTTGIPNYSSTYHPALYWDFTWARPITRKSGGPAIVVSGFGNWFWGSSRQFVTETKAASTIEVSLNAFKFAGFSLSPTYTWFAYENQVANDHVFVNEYSVKLGFNLDHRSRVAFWDAFTYGPPAPTNASQPPPPQPGSVR